MTSKSRYFLFGAAALLLIGLTGGLVAYFAYSRVAGLPGGLPAELRYVPSNAEVVAYADVRTVMKSELRRELERMASHPSKGRSEMKEFAGIDIETQVDHVVAYLEPFDEKGDSGGGPPRALVMVQGTFDQSRVEQFIREQGGTIEDYHGKHLATHKAVAGADDKPLPEQKGAPQPNAPGSGQALKPHGEMALGFIQTNLFAFGQADLVRRALDLSAGGSSEPNVTSSADVMKLVRDAQGSTAWVVGRFDAVSRRMGMPPSVRAQVPPLRLVSATARINGGIRATINAETGDQAAADQMRDVVRGVISLIRLQAGAKPELQNALKSVELSSGTNSVQLAFAMTPDTFRAIVPQRPGGPGRVPEPEPASPK